MMEMVWILTVYFMGVAGVHIAYNHFTMRSKRYRRRLRNVVSLHSKMHHVAPEPIIGTESYVFILNKDYSQIEWLIRSSVFVSWLKGRPIEINVLVTSNEPLDQTMTIIRKFADQEVVQLLSTPSNGKEQAALDKLMQCSTVLELDDKTPLRTVFQ